MSISIDWGTHIISVPKADLTLIQNTPTEIRELNLNAFHLELRLLEAGEEGMSFPITHNHNTEVTLGGLTFARVIEIINGYTITFEDGQYAVNLVGANSNIGDNVNVNQVSVRSQNSAGLISSPLIEFASFEGGVWVDTTSLNSGTLHPIGTRLAPVNNFSDAKLIADYRGFNTLFIIDYTELNEIIDFDEFIFEGQAHINNGLTISSDAEVYRAVFKNLSISGVLDGSNELRDCIIEDLIYVNGHIHNCGLIGEIFLDGNSDAVMVDCNTLDPYNPPIINMGGSGQNLAMPNYSGLLTIRNLNGANFVGIGLNAGQVVLEDTITNGTIHISGSGTLKDESGNHITSGTWNGGVTIINECISNETMTTLLVDSIWDEPQDDHVSSGSFGEQIKKIKFWVNSLRSL